MPLDTAPDRIGRYDIKGLIARGGMGRLYLARDPNTSRLVVLKLLDATLDSSELRDRFDREARALASLNHPNIIHIYDYGDFRESPFIVMEYVRGETLDEKIKRRARMSVAQKLKLMSELCAGLAHAHESDIIHRDVKPANLMVDQDERLKILDFGIARVADSNLTRVGNLAGWMQLQIGTPGYMSPEQTQGGDIDQRADIFAVGAVGYELFAYREAFPGATPKEIESKAMRTPPEPIAAHVPGFDSEIDAIIARALAKDRNHRYPDATALGEAFEACRLRLNPSNTPPPSRRPTPPAGPVGGPSSSRAEAAYARAVAAYQDNALDAARRFAIEALAEDPVHAGARALLVAFEPERPPASAPRPARPAVPAPTTIPVSPTSVPVPPISAGRRATQGETPWGKGPEVVSIDPTVLISRANRPAALNQIEPTILIRREDLPPRSTQTDETVIISPSRQRTRPASDPTVMITGKNRRPPSPPTPPFAPWLYLQPLWLGLKGLTVRRHPPPSRQPARKGGASAPVRRPTLWNPTTRGALVVLAALAGAAVVVLGAVRAGRWIWPSGQLLMLTKPVGGTIMGAGLQCGTRGADCSTTRPTGEPVELEAQADTGYVFSGFTGDCAPTGRMAMSQPRTCGATFDQVAAPPPVTWTLTIAKPSGGTIVSAGNILCGTLGSQCTANLPDGVPVTLSREPDAGFAFLQFTDDCAPNGETTMTAARTCGATFARTGPDVPVARPDPSPPRQPTKPVVTITAQTTTPAEPVTPPPAPTGQATTTLTTLPIEPIVPTASGDKQAPPPITAEAHAKEEIQELVKRYCAEHETLQPTGIQKLFPRVDQRQLRDQFRQYKSLTCSVTPPLEYDRLDANAVGGAQLRFGMKRVITMKSGGAPEVYETNVTMRVSRTGFTTAWVIDDVRHVEKPKP